MIKIYFRYALGLFIALILISRQGFSQQADCHPVLRLTSHNQSIQKLIVNKPDTVDVSVSCFSACEIIAEAEAIRITRLAKGKFLFTALKPGANKVYFSTACPNGATVVMNGYTLDVSGKRPVTETTVNCEVK